MERLGLGVGPAPGGGRPLSRLRALVDGGLPPEDALPGTEVTVRGPEAHRLIRVMRAHPGERIELFDGKGRACSGEIRTVGSDFLVVRLMRAGAPDGIGPESTLRTVLVQAVAKGDRMELALEKATELGVSEIWPVITRRCVARPEPSGNRVTRWRRVVENAARQAGRWVVPEVREPSSWDEALEVLAGFADRWLLVVAWEQADLPLGKLLERRTPHGVAGAALAVGPEGGLTDEEAHRALQLGFELVSLGPRVLRTETAGWLMLAMVQGWWGDLWRPAPRAPVRTGSTTPRTQASWKDDNPGQTRYPGSSTST